MAYRTGQTGFLNLKGPCFVSCLVLCNALGLRVNLIAAQLREYAECGRVFYRKRVQCSKCRSKHGEIVYNVFYLKGKHTKQSWIMWNIIIKIGYE